MGNGIACSIVNNTNFTLLEASADTKESSGGFMIQLLKEIKIGKTTVYITSTHVSLFIVAITLMIFALVVNHKLKHADINETPKGILNVAELLVETIDRMVYSIMGSNAKKFHNYIDVLFIFVLLSNVSGLFGLRPPTADYGITLPLGLITFALIQYNGIKVNKTRHFTDLFKPLWFLFPINLIGEFAVPLSLSLRLFGNVMSGTVLMGLIYELLRPFAVGWPAVLHVYFDVFSGCIQAYVICMLTMVYINDKIGD